MKHKGQYVGDMQIVIILEKSKIEIQIWKAHTQNKTVRGFDFGVINSYF